jgi:hypothetical protein
VLLSRDLDTQRVSRIQQVNRRGVLLLQLLVLRRDAAALRAIHLAILTPERLDRPARDQVCTPAKSLPGRSRQLQPLPDPVTVRMDRKGLLETGERVRSVVRWGTVDPDGKFRQASVPV